MRRLNSVPPPRAEPSPKAMGAVSLPLCLPSFPWLPWRPRHPAWYRELVDKPKEISQILEQKTDWKKTREIKRKLEHQSRKFNTWMTEVCISIKLKHFQIVYFPAPFLSTGGCAPPTQENKPRSEERSQDDSLWCGEKSKVGNGASIFITFLQNHLTI